MRKYIKIVLLSILLASSSAMAAEHQHNEAMQGMTMNAGQQWIDGVVKKVDQKKGQITLKHAAIANVMPAMTMSYKVAPSLKGIQAGDKVRFVLEKNNDDYVVTRIEMVR